MPAETTPTPVPDEPVLPATPLPDLSVPRRVSPRWASAIVFLCTGAVLGISLWLTPSAVGHGTHTQLGLPPCGFYVYTRLPCATCGMTTAFALAAHGQLWQSFVTQPGGCLLAIANAMAFLLSGYALVTGASLTPVGRMLARPLTFLALGALVLAAWAYTLAAAFRTL